MAGRGGEEDCQDAERPVRSGKGAGRGWRAVLLACCLCSSAQPDKADDEQEQEHYKHGNAGMMRWRNADISQLTTDTDKENKTGKTRESGQRKTPGQALARWRSRLFKKKAAPDTHTRWRWGVVLSQEERLRQRQEALRRERACLEAHRLRQEKEWARWITISKIHRGRRTVEANKVWSSLPMRAEDATRALTFRELSPNKTCTRTNERNLTHRELEWRKRVDEVRKEEVEKEMALSVRGKVTQLTSVKGKSFNLKEDLSFLVMAFAIFLFPKIWAIALSVCKLW